MFSSRQDTQECFMTFVLIQITIIVCTMIITISLLVVACPNVCPLPTTDRKYSHTPQIIHDLHKWALFSFKYKHSKPR